MNRPITQVWGLTLPTALFKYVLDLFLWTLAVPLAFWLRLETASLGWLDTILLYCLIGLPVKMVMLKLQGIHRQSWRRAGIRDLDELFRTILLGTFSLFLLGIILNPLVGLPRSVPLLEGIVAFFLLGSARLSLRLWFEQASAREAGDRRQHVLIVGAGDAGTMIAREMLRHPEAALIPLGFLDDDPTKRRDRIMGLKVFGSIEDLPAVAARLKPREIVIAMPSASGKAIRRVVELARAAKIRHRIVPGMYEILSGKVSISAIREVSVEDLLQREPVRLDIDGIAQYIQDQAVLVTGAGGSIGSEIVRQIARFDPRCVILLGRGENSLFELERELDRRFPDLSYETIVGNVQNSPQLRRVFESYRPQVVFHAAAHKHVPLMEGNPSEAILNNVGGTRNLAEMAVEFGVRRFVNISTDKAVHPTSIMGASKRVAEYVVAWAARHAQPGQQFVSVRFGNVLGSRGSVIPLFKKQIRDGGPVTVTDPEVTRYFMTIPEAVSLVLEAARLGENGSLYLLDMGEPVKIVHLAQDLIRLSGLEPGEDIEIVYTGLRPGEKLFEELLSHQEGTLTSKHEKIFVVQDPDLSTNGRGAHLDGLLEAASAGDDARIRELLAQLIPTYRARFTPQHAPEVEADLLEAAR